MIEDVAADYDVVVVGSGVAGLATALHLAGVRRVAVVSNSAVTERGGGSTEWAQGGLAAAVGHDDDPMEHARDTVVAAAGLADEAAVRRLADLAPDALADLVHWGGRLDRTTDDELDLTREGGHGQRRVAHAGGDATGAEVSRALLAAVRRTDVQLLDAEVVGLATADTANGPQVTGVRLRLPGGTPVDVAARAVVLATGGVGGLYAKTTNPSEVSGAGIGLALLAGASVVDAEFVQFHPTALAGGTSRQVPLVTEALRGEGAVLVDGAGRRIMTGQHESLDLAPRDVVARRVDDVIATSGGVWLDATSLGAAVHRRFPTVSAACWRRGLDLAAIPIPIEPAQHFSCGGVQTDGWGRTSVRGLYAVGEVAATGVHGANRLASNSLVEGMVFARRAGTGLTLDLPSRIAASATVRELAPESTVDDLRIAMSQSAGIRRNAAGLTAARDRLTDRPLSHQRLAALTIVTAALARQESRGCHWRSDHPDTSPWWRRRVVIRLGDDELPLATTSEPLARSA